MAMWIIAVCAALWTLRMLWKGFWAWYGERTKYNGRDDRKLISFVYRVLYGRSLR